MKARSFHSVKKFEDVPNIGPAMVRDFKLLGFKSPSDLKGKDSYKLYLKISKITGVRQDPCVLDTYMAVIDFMNGASPKQWWKYTPLRKKKYPKLDHLFL